MKHEAKNTTKSTSQNAKSNDRADDAPAQDMASSTDPSGPSRPLTRSQSGSLAKRKACDDKSQDLQSKDNRIQHKRAKRDPAPPKTSAPEADSSKDADQPPSPHSIPDSNSASSASASRAPRGQRTTLPVPVPNLTKKSRGRRVPTMSSADVPNEEENAGPRMYVCSVEGCGKCFHRGEHLKRHIRSIHTHEKPFKCEHPDCPKMFNRHDNLLQHLKVHKDLPAANGAKSNTKDDVPPAARRVRSQESAAGSVGRSSRKSTASPGPPSYPTPSPANNHRPSISQGPSIAEQIAAQTHAATYTPPYYPYIFTTPIPHPYNVNRIYGNGFQHGGIMGVAGGPHRAPPSVMDERAYASDMAVSSVRTEMPPQQAHGMAAAATSSGHPMVTTYMD